MSSYPSVTETSTRRRQRVGRALLLGALLLGPAAVGESAAGDGDRADPGREVTGWRVGLVWMDAPGESLRTAAPGDTLRLAVVLEGADALAGFRVRVHVEGSGADSLWRLRPDGPCTAPTYTTEIGAPALGPAPWKRALLLQDLSRDAEGRAHLNAAAAFDLAAILPRGARRPLCTLVLAPPADAGGETCAGWRGTARFFVEHATVLLRDGSERPVPDLGRTLGLRVGDASGG